MARENELTCESPKTMRIMITVKAVSHDRTLIIREQVVSSSFSTKSLRRDAGNSAKISQAPCKSKSNILLFGGLMVLFSGNFHQFPPVVDTALYINPSSQEMPLLVSQKNNIDSRVNDSMGMTNSEKPQRR